MQAAKPPYVAYDGLCTLLVLGGGKAVRAMPGTLEVITVKEADTKAYEILSEYPIKRWIELRGVENCGILIPRSVKASLAVLAANPNHEYNLEHFTKEYIMATAAKKAAATPATKTAKATKADAAPAVDAKKANAAKAAAAPAAKPAKAPKETAAPAAKVAKQPAKAAAAEGAGERKGRPSPHNLDAKIKKGSVDFKEHVREGTHRFFRYEFLLKNVGKKVGDVLGQETEDGVVIVSKHITGAIEANYISLDK